MFSASSSDKTYSRAKHFILEKYDTYISSKSYGIFLFSVNISLPRINKIPKNKSNCFPGFSKDSKYYSSIQLSCFQTSGPSFF